MWTERQPAEIGTVRSSWRSLPTNSTMNGRMGGPGVCMGQSERAAVLGRRPKTAMSPHDGPDPPSPWPLVGLAHDSQATRSDDDAGVAEAADVRWA